MKSKTLALILLYAAPHSLGAKVKLPALVGDNMILQQTEVKLAGEQLHRKLKYASRLRGTDKPPLAVPIRTDVGCLP